MNNVSVVMVEETTSCLVERARRAGNLQAGSKEVGTSRAAGRMMRTAPTKRTAPSPEVTDSTPAAKSRQLLPSVIFPKSDRPDWLMDDDVIDSFTAGEVGQFVSQ
jgi:hypothetical protein